MRSALHMGVPPDASASNQTGNLTSVSTSPPAPSDTRFFLVSTRIGLPASALISQR